MTNILVVIAVSALFTLNVAQSQTVTSPKSFPFFADAFVPESDNEKDPAYKTYKEGYALILSDKWSDAIKKFSEVKSKFPKSEYQDNAAYWSAYAQKRLDRKKGIAAYEKFISEFPDSRFVDDALSDMNDNFVVVAPDGKHLQVKVAPDGYAYSYGTSVRESERAMRDAERAMRNVERNVAWPRIRALKAPHVWSRANVHLQKKNLDAQTRLKLDALQALGSSGNDKESFTTLKDVALDKAQPEIMRITALESLGEFNNFDVLPVLVDVAKSDANEDIHVAALYTITDLRTDKNKSVDALILLYNGYPKQSEKQLQTALYAIADVGNDKAVDFLVKVANTSDNYDLRSDAVYYLGSIGNDKSRSALLHILKGK